MSQENYVPLDAFTKVYNLNKLIIDSGHSTSRDELIFYMLNHTAEYSSYDRAFLFDLSTTTKLLGVSGSTHVSSTSELVGRTRSAARSISQKSEIQIIDEHVIKNTKDWEQIETSHGTTSVLWLPIKVKEDTVAALWLERWENSTWTQSDLKLFKPLSKGYALAWSQHMAGNRGLRSMITTKIGTLLTIAAALAALFLIKLPLRLIADCEIVPKDPAVVTSPIDGVINKMNIFSGQNIVEGDLLFTYDDRVQQEELNVQKQQIKITESELERARATAFTNPESKELIVLLETRLKQERIKLQLAEYHSSKLTVTAPVSGTIMISAPNEWIGAPVKTGQRILQIINQQENKIKLWLPQNDKIELTKEKPAKIILNAKTAETHYAKLEYIAYNATLSPNGISSFAAEAEWEATPERVHIGLKGTAILYGKKVSLWYWLFRRPLAYVRSWTGH